MTVISWLYQECLRQNDTEYGPQGDYQIDTKPKEAHLLGQQGHPSTYTSLRHHLTILTGLEADACRLFICPSYLAANPA